MKLSPMSFKNFIWPHNPRIYEVEFKRVMAAHKIPFGAYVLQSMGRCNRVLRGEGEFVGENAYNDFSNLGMVFYEDSSGVLVHPLWQTTNAYMVSLTLKQEPRRDFVAYAFEFWEDYGGYDLMARQIIRPEAPAPAEEYHTVVRGDYLIKIANKYGLTLSEIIALNPQIKNPNLIYDGDKIRVK